MRYLICLSLLLMSQICYSENFSSEAQVKEMTTKVMEKVGAGDVEAGMKILKPYVGVPVAEFDAMVGQAVLQMPMILQRYGKPSGAEFIREERVGSSLVRYTYLARYENFAMRWVFYGYKGASGWIIAVFKFDDQLFELFPH